MFAEGDVATTQSTPGQMVDIPNLINYYVSQGYNSIDIKEMLPEVPMAVIESAVNALGGSVNPAISSPGADEFSGNINPFVEMQETTTLANQQGDTTINPSFPQPATPPELPSEADISMIPEDIRRYMDATAGLFDNEGMVTAIMMNFDLSEEEARSIVGMSPNPDTNIGMIDPSLEKVSLTSQEDGLPNVTGIGAASDLKPNEYRDSNGIVHEISSELLKELLSGESSRIIKGVLSNPNVSYGTEIAKIIEAEALGRSSTLVDPSKIRVGAQDIILNPESLGDKTLKLLVDAGKEGVEGLFNTVKGLGSSRMVGIFRGRDAAKRAKEAGRDEYMDIFDTPLSGQGSIADNLREISEYGNTGGETAKTLDSIILEASLSPPDGIDTNQKDLEDLEKKKGDKDKVNLKNVETSAETGTGTSAETGTGTSAETGTGTSAETGTGTSADPAGTGAVAGGKDEKKPSDDFEEEERNLISMIGTAFNSDANLRLMRNIGKSLTATGNLADGIGIGSAQASEERALKDLEDEAAKKELLLKKLEGQTLDYKEANAIKDNNKELSANIRVFQKTQKNVKEIDKALNIIKEEGGFGIQGSIQKFVTAAAVAMGKSVKKWDSLDPRTKIDAITKVLQQSNIQEILGESGRTISNLDREVIQDVFGSMTFTTSEAEIIKKLEDSRAKTLTASNETRGEIAAAKDYFDMTGRGSVVIEQNKDLVDLILQFDPDSFTYEYGQKVVDVDYRDKFKK